MCYNGAMKKIAQGKQVATKQKPVTKRKGVPTNGQITKIDAVKGIKSVIKSGKRAHSLSECALSDVPKNKGGRPRRFKTVAELQEKIDAYFESCWADRRIEKTDKDGIVTVSFERYRIMPYTVMGLVLALGFNSRTSFNDYKAAPEYMAAIKNARTRIELSVEALMLEGKNPAGPIFWLKNNAEEKYRDKYDHEVGLDARALEAILAAMPPDYAAAVREHLHKLATEGGKK